MKKEHRNLALAFILCFVITTTLLILLEYFMPVDRSSHILVYREATGEPVVEQFIKQHGAENLEWSVIHMRREGFKPPNFCFHPKGTYVWEVIIKLKNTNQSLHIYYDQDSPHACAFYCNNSDCQQKSMFISPVTLNHSLLFSFWRILH